MEEAAADEDPEVFECDTCPVAEQLAGLDPFNERVWRVYKQSVCRLSADLHAGGAVLERLTRDLDDDDFVETWRRLVKLYDILQPPPAPKGTT